MKCRNCGFPKTDHVRAAGLNGPIALCPDGSGDSYPATVDVSVELHYRAGDESPWVAKWVHPLAGAGEVVATQPTDALRLAANEIDKTLEEKTADEKAVEEAIGRGR